MEPRRHGRPISYSESHIHLPRQMPLIGSIASVQSFSSFEIESESPPPSPPPPKPPWTPFLYNWFFQSLFHLTLISLFETLFFWQFVSVTEDGALIGLVDTYIQNTLNGCAAMTSGQRAITTDMLDLFINQTTVAGQGAAAATQRASYNNGLFRNSWLYFGGLATAVVSLAGSKLLCCSFVEIKWRTLLIDNLTLILFLGAYEWMFFSTIVLKYQTISMPELDQRVVAKIMAIC